MTHRPASVTSLMLAVLTLAAWNAVRLYAAIANWNVLMEFAAPPGPLYIALSASFWTLSGLATWTAIRRRHPRARTYCALYILGYALWWWADRIFLQNASPNWPFAIGLTILLLSITAFDLFNKKTISHFRQRETHDQTNTDTNPA